MSSSKIGLVIIGRNEALHLKRNLPKLADVFYTAVFVDSDSSDNSIEIAKNNALEVVELDLSKPFTAGRARNEGWQWLLAQNPDLDYIQFIDGDCELSTNFITNAVEYMEDNPKVAVVAGRRRELYPEASLYNAMCEVEWNSPVGAAKSCGGDFLIRASVLTETSGFNPTVIAGEEPEMCVRIRAAGHEIHRLDQDMTFHDANMHSVKQWWLRSERAGHAYAQGYAIHGQAPESMNKREVIRILVLGSFFIFALLVSIFIDIRFLLLLLVYPFQAFRVYKNFNQRDHTQYQRKAYAISCGFAYVPQFFGILKFYWRRITGVTATIIEYK